MRIARALFSLIGSAIVGLLITFAAIPEWTLMNLDQHLWQTIGGFLISAAFGGAVAFIVYAAYMGWKLGSKPCKAFDDLRGIGGLGDCKSLSDMVGPVRRLASLRGEIAARDAEIAALEKRPTPEQLSELEVERDALRAEADRLSAFKEEATPRLLRLAEFEEKFDLRRFNVAQLRTMLHCFCEESVGNYGIRSQIDNPTIDYLEEEGVLRRSTEPVSANWDYAFVLTPDWRRFIAKNELEIRALIGERS